MNSELEKYKETLLKAARYDELKQDLQKYEEKFDVISKLLTDLKKEICPSCLITGSRKQHNYKDTINELYALMKSGTHISAALIRQSHSEIPMNMEHALMQKLKALPNVQTRKEGRNVYLYI